MEINTNKCRLCLKENIIYLDRNSEEYSIAKIKITEIFKFNIKDNDNLPTNICKQCFKEISRISLYIDKVLLNQKSLIEYQENTSKNEFYIDYNLETIKKCDNNINLDNNLQSKEENIRKQNKRIAIPEHLTKRSTKSDSDAKIRDFVNLTCDLCKKLETNINFSTFKELQQHFVQIHNEKGYVMCCGKKLNRKDRLISHIINHTNPEAFKCPECGQVAKNKGLLILHMKMHLPSDQYPYECDKCNKRFILKSHLTNHKATHISKEERKFVCDICDKRFALNFVMLKHKKIHTEEKNFICDICAKTFYFITNLKSHMLSHKNLTETRVQCKCCLSYFKNIDTLRSHVKRQHSNKNNNNENNHNNDYLCDICNKVLKSKIGLNEHKRYVHEKLKKFQCQLCDRDFCKKIEYTEHMARHRNEQLYKCPFCPRTFSASANFFSHRKNYHPIEFQNLMNKNKFSENIVEPVVDQIVKN